MREPSRLFFRWDKEMRALLVVLILSLAAGGVFLAVRRDGGGIELRYSVRFPAGFAGDRKTAGLEVVRHLGARLDYQGRAWMAFVDRKGVITLRVAAVKPEEIPSLRRVLETEGQFEVYEVADSDTRAFYDETGEVPCGYLEVRLTKRMMEFSPTCLGGLNFVGVPPPKVLLVRERPAFDSSDILPIIEEKMGVVQRPMAYLEMRSGSATQYAERRAKELLIMLEGNPFSTTDGDSVGMDGWFWIPGAKDEEEAKDIEAIYGSGQIPYPIGEPEIGVFRGKLR